MPPPPLPSIPSACWYERAAIRLIPLQRSLPVSKRSDALPMLDRASLALLTHTLSFMHSLTQVEPYSDSSLERTWSIKQGRLAGLRSDIGFALQGEVTVIGEPFKAPASPGRMVSKLTAFAGFIFAELTGRCSALSYTTTNSGFRAALNTVILFFVLPTKLVRVNSCTQFVKEKNTSKLNSWNAQWTSQPINLVNLLESIKVILIHTLTDKRCYFNTDCNLLSKPVLLKLWGWALPGARAKPLVGHHMTGLLMWFNEPGSQDMTNFLSRLRAQNFFYGVRKVSVASKLNLVTLDYWIIWFIIAMINQWQ